MYTKQNQEIDDSNFEKEFLPFISLEISEENNFNKTIYNWFLILGETIKKARYSIIIDFNSY